MMGIRRPLTALLEVSETFSKFFHSKEAVLGPREYTVPKGR